VIYSAVAAVFAGLHWAYATVAILLSTLGGLLPDLDSPSAVGLRGFTGILGLMASLLVWRSISELDRPPGFEFHLWAVMAAYVLVRHGLRRLMVRIAVHRGMCHSVPTCGIWGALTYLLYPSDHLEIRIAMAIAVMLGFLSHLLLDELCSVDIQGVRVNKAFGTAFKFWGPSALSTIFVYACLSLLSWRIIRQWPEDVEVPTTLAAPGPVWPYPWPQSWLKDGFKDFRVFAQDQVERLPERVEQAKAITAKEFEGLPEDLAKAKQFVAKQLSPQDVAKAKRFVTDQLPQAAEQLRKVAEAKKFPLPRRR